MNGYLSLVDGHTVPVATNMTRQAWQQLARTIVAKAVADGAYYVPPVKDEVPVGWVCNQCGAAEGAQHNYGCRMPRGLVKASAKA